jgi:uncharacterized protein
MNDIQQKISEINGQKIAEGMDEKGYILLSQFLPVKYCKELIDKYGNEHLYRKIITLEKYRFGLGEYKYFKYPLPNLIHIIRKDVYPILAPIANNWMRLLNLKRQFPNEFEKLQQLYHDNNQTECTVLILKYGKGGFNTLHQVYMEIFFFPSNLYSSLMNQMKTILEENLY